MGRGEAGGGGGGMTIHSFPCLTQYTVVYTLIPFLCYSRENPHPPPSPPLLPSAQLPLCTAILVGGCRVQGFIGA